MKIKVRYSKSAIVRTNNGETPKDLYDEIFVKR